MNERTEAGAPLALRQEPKCLAPIADAEGHLMFQWRSPGQRYYLDGKGVHAGDILEMELDDGAWERVRYEYTWEPSKQRLQAFLHFRGDQCLALTETMRFRWPCTHEG